MKKGALAKFSQEHNKKTLMGFRVKNFYLNVHGSEMQFLKRREPELKYEF